MNKEQLVSAIARKMKAAKGEENRYAKWEIEVILPYVLGAISETLADGEEVQLQGFGRFSIKTLKAHNAVNPRTKEHVWVPEKRKVVFLPTPHFKFNEPETVEKASDTAESSED